MAWRSSHSHRWGEVWGEVWGDPAEFRQKSGRTMSSSWWEAQAWGGEADSQTFLEWGLPEHRHAAGLVPASRASEHLFPTMAVDSH